MEGLYEKESNCNFNGNSNDSNNVFRMWNKERKI